MTKIIVATETYGCETRNLVIVLDVFDENINIEQAVSDACKEYCLTDEGKRTYEGNCNCFNWGDFDAYVPDEICERHGFRKVDSVSAEEFIFDQQLVDENDIFPEEDEK